MIRKIFLLAAFMSAIIYCSCNDSNVGIFYGLSNEEKVSDYSLPNHLTSDTIVKVNGQLYLAAGTIYTKPSGGGKREWTKVSSPDGYRFASEMAALSDGTIFIISYDVDDAKTMMFKGDGSGTWEKVSTPADGKLSKMRIANDVIYLSDKNGNFYYSTDKGSSFNKDTSLPGQKLFSTSTGYFDLVTDGSVCYLNAQYTIYKGKCNSWTPFQPRENDGSRWKDKDETYTRLYYNGDADRLYASDTDGYLYAVNSPASAGEKDWIQSDNNTPSGIGIQGMVQVNVRSSGGKNHSVLLIGSGITGGKGYYEVWDPEVDKSDRDKINPKRPKHSNEYISDYYDYLAFDISEAAVTNFFVDYYDDGINFDIYAMTYGYGVWKNSLKGSERGWNRE
ncbi:MAG: hypothetical protein MJ215_02310 [Spirochaetia bacterium]|nr:hypothetical protein [Spirochaetia bacterium]